MFPLKLVTIIMDSKKFHNNSLYHALLCSRSSFKVVNFPGRVSVHPFRLALVCL